MGFPHGPIRAPTPLWERQIRSDQPTADPALIGFFFFSLCSQGTKILLWRERRGVPAIPSLELIGYVTRWPNPPGLMCGRQGHGVGTSESAPSGSVSAAQCAEEGDPRGRPPLCSYLLFPQPQAAGMFIHRPHLLAGRQACLLLERMLESPVPEESGKGGTFLRTCLCPALRWSSGFGNPPVTVALPLPSFQPCVHSFSSGNSRFSSLMCPVSEDTLCLLFASCVRGTWLTLSCVTSCEKLALAFRKQPKLCL